MTVILANFGKHGNKLLNASGFINSKKYSSRNKKIKGFEPV